MEHTDYYEILGIGKNSDQKQIKNAYRTLAFKYHPDRNSDSHASSRMKDINEAYAVLSDPKKRNEYNAMKEQFGSGAHSRFRQDYSDDDIFSGSDIHQIFEELSKAFGLRGFDEVFKQFQGRGYSSHANRRPGIGNQAFFFTGSSRPGAMRAKGFPIGGLARLIRYGIKRKFGIEIPEKGKDLSDVIAISPSLAFSGGKIRYLYRPQSKELVVTIPPGVTEGQRIRLRGMGAPGKGGGLSGDLYVKIRIRIPVLERIRRFLENLFFRRN